MMRASRRTERCFTGEIRVLSYTLSTTLRPDSLAHVPLYTTLSL